MNKLNALRILPCVFFGLALISITSPADAAHSHRYVSNGTSTNLGHYYPSAMVGYPSASDQGAIVGMAMAGSNDHVFVWYADGHVSSGTPQNFQYHSGLTDYSLPSGKNYWDIVAMAIAGSNDHVYTWYSDGTVSEGWSQDLGAYGSPQPFSLPPDRAVSDIVGIGIAGSDDRVYAFYSDGTVSIGWSQDLDYHSAPYSYSVPAGKKIGHIIDIGIAGSNDHVYAWYHDVEVGAAYANVADEIDAAAMDVLRRWRLPGLGVSVSKNGRVIAEKGYGFGNFSTGKRMDADMRCRIGSVSKIITALSAMHLHENDANFDVSMDVYGFGGALPSSLYSNAYAQGINRHQPIVAKAIASDDHVFTWNHDLTVSVGTSVDPDYHSGPYDYSLPPGMSVEDIRAMAISTNDRVWVWYDDGTYSVGSSWNLDHYVERDPDVKVSVPGHGMSHIVGIALSPSNTTYVWYDDGTQSAGSTTNFGSTFGPRPYSTTPGKSPYFISGIGIAKSNSHVYTWYNDGTFTRGTSTNLDHYAGPASYTIPGYAFDLSKDWNAYYADMKVDHLLSHTSGLSRSGDVGGAESMFSTIEDMLDYRDVHEYVLRTRKLKFAPGSSSSYSNHGAGLVGHIVAERSGQSFRQYALANVLGPLGLDVSPFAEGQTASDMHRHTYQNELPSAYVDDSTNDLGLAAGGWKSSAGDLVRLMLGTDQLANHADILSPSTLNSMETRPYPSATSYAHGWKRSNAGRLDHSGRLGGGTTYIAKFPANYTAGWGAQQINVAVCTNVSISDARGASGPLSDLARAIAETVDAASVLGGYDLY